MNGLPVFFFPQKGLITRNTNIYSYVISKMENNQKKEKPYLRIFVRGTFPKSLEERLVKNWNVLPLRVLDQCRKQGVRFVTEHKKGFSIEKGMKSWITRKGMRLRIPWIVGATVEDEESADSILLQNDSGTTIIGIADEFALGKRKVRIAFCVESEKIEDIDQISEYQERFLSDLMLILTATQDVLQQEDIEIQVEVVSILLGMPEDSRIREQLDKKPLISWLQNLFGLPKREVTSFEIDVVDFNWKEGEAERSIAIRESSLQYEVGNMIVRGEPLTISQKVNSLIAEGLKIVQHMKQIVFAEEE